MTFDQTKVRRLERGEQEEELLGGGEWGRVWQQGHKADGLHCLRLIQPEAILHQAHTQGSPLQAQGGIVM